MLIEHLDRTLWTLDQAHSHVAARISAHIQADPERLAMATRPEHRWQPPRELSQVTSQIAWEEIQIALRDGDLHAVGRLSTERAAAWSSENDGWRFHSGRHSSITPEQWRAGQPSRSATAPNLLDGHFIDVRVPRFMVLAIWPVPAEPAPKSSTSDVEAYETPYMKLLKQGVADNGISEQYQGKKELLSEWFRGQTVDGEPISQNLADVMATLIRLPGSQRGGAKRAY